MDARQADDGALAGGVGMRGEVVVAADQAQHRGDVHDRAAPCGSMACKAYLQQ